MKLKNSPYKNRSFLNIEQDDTANINISPIRKSIFENFKGTITIDQQHNNIANIINSPITRNMFGCFKEVTATTINDQDAIYNENFPTRKNLLENKTPGTSGSTWKFNAPTYVDFLNDLTDVDDQDQLFTTPTTGGSAWRFNAHRKKINGKDDQLLVKTPGTNESTWKFNAPTYVDFLHDLTEVENKNSFGLSDITPRRVSVMDYKEKNFTEPWSNSTFSSKIKNYQLTPILNKNLLSGKRNIHSASGKKDNKKVLSENETELNNNNNNNNNSDSPKKFILKEINNDITKDDNNIHNNNNDNNNDSPEKFNLKEISNDIIKNNNNIHNNVDDNINQRKNENEIINTIASSLIDNSAIVKEKASINTKAKNIKSNINATRNTRFNIGATKKITDINVRSNIVIERKLVTVPKEFHFSKRFDQLRRVTGDPPPPKFSGVKKPIKKTIKRTITVPKPFKFHDTHNKSRKQVAKSPIVSLAERVKMFIQKTPERLKSRLVTFHPLPPLSFHPPTKPKSPFLHTKLRSNKENKVIRKDNKYNNKNIIDKNKIQRNQPIISKAKSTIYAPKKSNKPLTKPIGFKFKTETRIKERKLFNEERKKHGQPEIHIKKMKVNDINQQEICFLQKTTTIQKPMHFGKNMPTGIKTQPRRLARKNSPMIGEKRRLNMLSNDRFKIKKILKRGR
ncbi:9519_t:CDS:2 [Entrophospora sp. SA101]|nr:14370_t:CDS:2 [Entrophospora sp. SA101]CAJ0905571.1 9519_t:CDS:2 [Entrophospora sp. SA101]